ncbi:formate dehydrogenase [Salipaludibacillus keqinensis]|uniref:Formate dehydrogenase n=3 Tax=Salipaludibacillus keqinensis TaxID=2045207 RepID=A0A323THH7_9BACI|nr:formate dehydrogenase [Salipaludibacillus keqinensis]
MDIDRADVLLLIGSNTTDAHPIIANRMKKAAKKGLKIVVIDPRKISMTKSSVKHLPLRVGSDIALMNGIMNVIIENEWHNQPFVEQNSAKFEQLKKHVASYPLDKVEQITGVDKKDIFEAAKLYALADRAMICYTLGITEHHCGVNNVFDIANMALLTGHIGRVGTGIMPLRGQNNVQGAGDMGCLPNQLPGGISLADSKYRNTLEQAWNVSLNPTIGKTQTGMLEKMEDGLMKALYIIGENPIVADVHKNHTTELFKKLDFLVVQDLFMTETAELADVVLPAKGWAEVEGTYTNTDRRVQRVRKAVSAQGIALDDWKILSDLATLMGYPMNYQSSEQIWNEVRQTAPHLYGGMSYERLEKEMSLQYPCPDETHPGTAIIHQELHLKGKKDRLAPFTPVDYTEPVELPDQNYPFTLTTGRRYEPYNTHTQTKYYPDTLKRKQFEETVDIHPDDAERLTIKNGEYVLVSSRRGEVKVKARITEEVQPNLVFMSFHWPEVPTNVLTINEFDPISGTAEYKACAVNVKKISS